MYLREALRERALKCRFIKSGIVFLLAFITFAAACAFLFLRTPFIVLAEILLYSFTGISAVLCVTVPVLQYKNFSYAFHNGTTEICKGFYNKNKKLIPASSVIRAELAAGPLERILSLSTVNLYTAAAKHSVPYVDKVQAEELLRNILKAKS